MVKKPKKFIRSKKKENIKESPKNNRSITETKLKKPHKKGVFKEKFVKTVQSQIWVRLASIVLIGGIIFVGIQLKNTYAYLLQINTQKQEIESLIVYWKQIISKAPGYRDAYIEVAILYYRLKDRQDAEQYVEKAIVLDPNYAPARELQKQIVGE